MARSKKSDPQDTLQVTAVIRQRFIAILEFITTHPTVNIAAGQSYLKIEDGNSFVVIGRASEAAEQVRINNVSSRDLFAAISMIKAPVVEISYAKHPAVIAFTLGKKHVVVKETADGPKIITI